MEVNSDPSDSSHRKRPHEDTSEDIEDMGQKENAKSPGNVRPVVTRHLTTPSQQQIGRNENWRNVLGPPPDKGTTRVGKGLAREHATVQYH